jgi:hypothetical protein
MVFGEIFKKVMKILKMAFLKGLASSRRIQYIIGV